MLKSVGLFFIYMGTVAFTKTYLNPAQHIALQSRDVSSIRG